VSHGRESARRSAVLKAILLWIALLAAGCASAGPPSSGPAATPAAAPARPPVPSPVSGDAAAEGPTTTRPPGSAGAFAAWREAEVRLRPPTPDDGPPTGLVIVPPASPLPVGVPARASALPAGERSPRPDLPVTWRSGDESVLRVGGDGVLLGLVPGRARLEATAAGMTAASEIEVVPDRARLLLIDPVESFPVAGEVVHFTATARTADGTELEDARVLWSAAPFDGDPPARVDPDGAFVAPAGGAWRVTAARGTLAATAVVHASPRPAAAGLVLLGVAGAPPEGGPLAGVRAFEGLDGRDWAWTWTLAPERIHVWDVTDPGRPGLVRTLDPGGAVTDLEVAAGAAWAVAALADAEDGRGGLVVFDLAAPWEPRRVATIEGELEGGAVAVALDGTTAWAAPRTGGGLVSLDLSDPARPRRIGGWTPAAGSAEVADLVVRDGLAWVARWHDGLAILDVGAGIRDGSPGRPALVAEHRYRTLLDGRSWGNTLRVVPWRDRVLLADGIASCPSCATGPRGGVHVLDVTDVVGPGRVAWYRPPETGARELRVDPERELLIGAFAEGGLRVLDMSGEMRGDLGAQERESARARTGPADPASRSMAWGVDLLKGAALVTDLYGGLRIYRIEDARGEPDDVLPG
jgi:hypothetical protein